MADPPATEEYYLKGIATGDLKVIDKIYKNYSKAIIHLVETHKGTLEDARDVFQEALLLVYQKSKDPDFQLKSSFLTYFYAICRNIWYNKMKKKSFGEVTLTEDMKLMLTTEVVIEIEQNEQFQLYRTHFKRLGEDCQKLLQLFYEKVSMTKIAEIMGYTSEGYAKKRKFYCKKQLIALIEKDPKFRELKF